jgi:hypothetical protein
MTDLTNKFEAAIGLKNNSFNEMRWYSALKLLAEKANLTFLWDDIDDKWIKLGKSNMPSLMVARYCPLMFAEDAFLVEEFVRIYPEDFVYEIFKDNISEDYCIQADKIREFFPWYTEVVSPDKFSLEDLFYATH